MACGSIGIACLTP
ncbi:hypothetical protein MTR11_22000 [Vibrio sp. CCB-PB317]|nr:hypothetical protein [Vibrio sp. CCB-PB317]